MHRPLRVLVASTGTELIDAPTPLRHGQIYESNSVMLAAAVRELGCEVEVVRSVVDDVEEFRKVIEPKLADADLLVTSGGVSAGAYEVVKDALTGQGVEFAKIAMQPGGPQGCGRWQGVPVVTLPGNPVSVLVSFEAFLRPALLTALGHTDVSRRRVRARLTEEMPSPGRTAAVPPGRVHAVGRGGHRDRRAARRPWLAPARGVHPGQLPDRAARRRHVGSGWRRGGRPAAVTGKSRSFRKGARIGSAATSTTEATHSVSRTPIASPSTPPSTPASGIVP